jgi:hypothetical protein
MKTFKSIKTGKTILLALFALSFLIVSCKKDDNNNSGSSNLDPGKSQISCNVSGAVSSSFSSVLLTSGALKSGLLMNISGGTTSLPIQMMMFIIPSDITVGTHNLTTNEEFTVSYSSNETGWSAGNIGDDFTLTVTKNTATEFEGTFSGKLINEENETFVNITNGKIAAKF